ncbi:glucoamylase family protein [Paracoccus sp. CPCC 101403]|uniref:Glucoamylase family protein n=1 Tax=Paracoccus broussonetiae TaxID=3075834 RepID=A0ABU3EIJ6_9RHOB|nr:glucoamylase family protein [Paracoccus sp. CPCC 101403]MDT1064068.1 glucoamylase family protein [Paracoccus sp. CPCC 101403]
MADVIRGLDDAALRDRVAQASAAYFLDWSHPVSGMARERSAGDFGYDVAETVCTGGTGFGLLAQIVAVERGWRPRREILDRLERVLDFLERADRFEGVFPHFLNGTTGRVLPFMVGDDGGDLVETAFLMLGLLGAGAYFDEEPWLVARIQSLFDAVNWAAHLREDGAVMWHRHPDRPWTEKSLPIRGWNEAFPVFVLGAGSRTHALPATSYHKSWARAPAFRNGQVYGRTKLPLGLDWGGPLFLSQYPFLGIDPRGLRDAYADYGVQARAHALVNRTHCLSNPHGWKGYGPKLWGLTASDDPTGYVAHSPTEDTGVITPTAALSSLPFAPREVMPVLRHLHDDLGERIWGEAGFVDAFSVAQDWTAESRLAVDQAPIVIGLENHRSGLLWRLVSGRPEVRRGLRSLGFTAPWLQRQPSPELPFPVPRQLPGMPLPTMSGPGMKPEIR